MTSSEIKSLSLGTITKRDASLWEIAFQLAIRNESLAATEQNKSFDRGEPGRFSECEPIGFPALAPHPNRKVEQKAPQWHAECEACGPVSVSPLVQALIDCVGTSYLTLSCAACNRYLDFSPRSETPKPSAEAQTQPPKDFVGKLISAELHYTNPAVPPGLVRVTLDVTDAEYQKLLDSQKLAATEDGKTETTREPGDIKEGFEPPVDEWNWNSIHTYRRGNPENRFCCKCGAGELHPIHGIPAHLSQGWQPPNTSTEEPKTKENKKP